MDAIPRTIGPYRILEALGRGGMGVVYRAEHEASGEPAAIKTVRVPQEAMLQGLRREIHALARLRHPGIVRILAEGVEAGLPWYAMELVRGATLRSHCERLGEGPEGSAASLGATNWWTQTLAAELPTAVPGSVPRSPPPRQSTARARRPRAARGALGQVLTLVRRLCRALAYLHGEGLVHRDLKPDNVLVRMDGTPVLVDFGLACQFSDQVSREALEVAGLTVGTLVYMPPEQLRGELVDARADLYALGCILYALLTGRPPFAGLSQEELVQAHLHLEPEPPSKLVEGVAPQLDALLLKLLAKRPQDRLGHADNVASMLAELGAEDEGSGLEPKSKAYLYRPRFVGRHEPLRVLEQAVGRLHSGAGGLVLVGGESGVGKTRLLLELSRQARRSGVTVLLGEGLARRQGGAGGRPLQTLGAALQHVADRCREGGLAETERLLGPRGRLLQAYEPALRGLQGQEAHPEPAELPPAAARLRLFGALAATFEALAEGSGQAIEPGCAGFRPAPVMLILDDLQWCDELTLGFLEYLLRIGAVVEPGRAPLLVVGAYRSEEAGPAKASPLRVLIETPGVERLALGRLKESSVGAMISDMLCLQPLPPRFRSSLSRHSEGNPFFLAEYLRAAVAEGLLYRDGAGHWQVVEDTEVQGQLPRSVRELVGRRLDALSEEGLALAEVASVLGREMDEGLLAEVAEVGGEERLEAAQELLAREVLEEPSGGRLRFVHDKLREAAYGRLAEEQRRRLHRRAAEALWRRSEGGAEPPFAELGRHWEQAGERERARPCYLAAAREASERHGHEQAERMYRAFLTLAEPPSAESIRARNELGAKVLYLQGRGREALVEHQTALEQALALGDRAGEALSLKSLAYVALKLGQTRLAWEKGERSLALYRELGDRKSEGDVLFLLGVHCQEHSELEQAGPLLEQALAIYRELGFRSEEGRTLNNLGILLDEQGRLPEALAAFEQALEFLRDAKERRHAVVVLGNIANIRSRQGRPEDARAMYREGLSIVRDIGDRLNEAWILANLGVLEQESGNLEKARHPQEQALQIYREAGERRAEGVMLGNLALVAQEQGRLEDAEALFEQALALSRAVGDARWEGIWLLYRARMKRQEGRLAEASAGLEEAEALLQAVDDRWHLAMATCERGHLCLAEGRSGLKLLDQSLLLAAGEAAEGGLLGRAVERLARAEAVFQAGEGKRLSQGEAVEDIPAGLRRRLGIADQR